MKQVFAVADTVSDDCRWYITPGKEYAAIPHRSPALFYFVGDDGEQTLSSWESSAHLAMGSWRRVERDLQP